jgi:hypothetical protein
MDDRQMNHQNQDRLQLYKIQIPGIDQSMAESMVESMELVESMVVENMGLVEVEVEQEHQKDHQKDRRNRRYSLLAWMIQRQTRIKQPGEHMGSI